MLVLQKELWHSDKILKILSTLDWEASDTEVMLNCVFAGIEELLQDAIKKNVKCVIILDCNRGNVPPIYYIGKCITFLLRIKKLIADCVYFTLIYDKDEDQQKKWVDIILKMYTPTRPIFSVNSRQQILKILSEKEKVDFNYKVQ
jgi:hypothetical protein